MNYSKLFLLTFHLSHIFSQIFHVTYCDFSPSNVFIAFVISLGLLDNRILIRIGVKPILILSYSNCRVFETWETLCLAHI